MMDFDNEIDAFFGSSTGSSPSEDMVSRMEEFVAKHSGQLRDMQEAVAQSVNELWDHSQDPVRLSMPAHETNQAQDQSKNDENRDSSSSIAAIVSLCRNKTDNQLLNKVATVLCSVAAEIQSLKRTAATEFYGPLTMFGHSADLDDIDNVDGGGAASTDTSLEVQFGHFIPCLQKLANFSRRCRSVLGNVVSQLASLYSEHERLYKTTFKHVHISGVWTQIGQLLTVLATLDHIIRDNQAIEHAWTKYKKMVKYIRAEPERFGLEPARLRQFETLLVELDGEILAGRLLDAAISVEFQLDGSASQAAVGKIPVSTNRRFFEEFTWHVKSLMKAHETNFGVSQQRESLERIEFVHFLGLYALYRHIFKMTSKPDQKLFKQIWSFQKRIPVIPLYGRAVLFVGDFLREHAPLQMKSLSPSPQELDACLRDCLVKHDQGLAVQVRKAHAECTAWMVQIDASLKMAATTTNSSSSSSWSGRKISTVISARSRLLLNGLLLANHIRNLITTSLALHIEVETAFALRNIDPLCLCCEMLKAIEGTFHRASVMLGHNLAHMLGIAQFHIKRVVAPLRDKLRKMPRLDDTKLDVLAACNLCLGALTGPPTGERLLVAELTSQLLSIKGMLTTKDQDEVRHQLWKLTCLADLDTAVKRACDCQFLYWSCDILLPAFFRRAFETPNQIHRLPYLLAALRDPLPMLSSVAHQSDTNEYSAAYCTDVLAFLDDEVCAPLCRAIENNLRLHIHSVVLNQGNLKKDDGHHDLARFLALAPLRVFDKHVDLRARVQHYLDTSFYNMATVALHDWKIYAEMKNLAREKYGLQLTETHLPSHSHYSEGLDVLEIMRNVHIFVSKYNYNLNTQMFVERSTDQKHLNSINIAHIANSIRTHGTGIMNTTVNFTFQFLGQKFLIFSEFLFDDHIRSRLMKDARFFKEKRDELDNRYPYQRADKFNRDIRKLGTTDDGHTFLDQFRTLITEIGNALGYVRMVRSGGLNHCSRAIKFVPDLDDIISFEEFAAQDALSPETLDATRNLDKVIEHMTATFAEGTDFYQLLVRAFSGALAKGDHGHLRFFPMIVPPLTINWVEKMLVAKEKLRKKGRTETAFTDDGFALGLAFILKVLGHNESFESLHWFDSIRLHLTMKQRELEAKQAQHKKQTKKSSASDDLQSILLTLKRVETLRRENDLFFFTFQGARVFFRDTKTKAEETAAKAKEAENSSQSAEGAQSAPAPAAASASAPATSAAAPPPPPAAGAPPPPPPPPPPPALPAP